VKVNEEVEMVGFGTDKKVVVTGVEMSASCWMRGRRGTTSGSCCAGWRSTSGAGDGAGEAEEHHAAHAVRE